MYTDGHIVRLGLRFVLKRQGAPNRHDLGEHKLGKEPVRLNTIKRQGERVLPHQREERDDVGVVHLFDKSVFSRESVVYETHGTSQHVILDPILVQYHFPHDYISVRSWFWGVVIARNKSDRRFRGCLVYQNRSFAQQVVPEEIDGFPDVLYAPKNRGRTKDRGDDSLQLSAGSERAFRKLNLRRVCIKLLPEFFVGCDHFADGPKGEPRVL